jgi:cytochrome b561
MALRNTPLRYGTVAASFHWIIAAFILFQLWLGLYMVSLPHSDPSAFGYVQLHKSIGLTILVLSVGRLLWRLVNRVPPLPKRMNIVLRGIAHLSHFFLYVLIIGIPLSGWAMTSASPLGLPIKYFGLFDWPKIWFLADMTREQKRPLGHMLGDVHMYLAFSLIGLLVIHVCGALYHQFILRDTVLKRMIPGTHVEEEAA